MRTLDAAAVDELERLGFLRFVPEHKRVEVKRWMVERSYPFHTDVARDYMADAEDLAEQGVRNFLGAVADFLRAEGVPIEVTFGGKIPPRPIDDDTPERFQFKGIVTAMQVGLDRSRGLVEVTETYEVDGYTIRLGTESFVVWGEGEVNDSWSLATIKTIELLNRLLAAHGSKERAWGLMGGNDLNIVFATPEQVAIINSGLSASDKLHNGYEPTE